jgi:YVTN family beta-propeller protein
MSGEDKAEARLRELLRDPGWSLPAGPDPEQRVRRAARRQRLRLTVMAGVAVAVIAVAIPAGLGVFGQTPRPEQPPAAPTLYFYGYYPGIGPYGGIVTPVNTATGTPGKSIYVGASGIGPENLRVTPNGPGVQIVITPDGKTAYVTTGPSVTPVSTATNTPGTPIHVRGGLTWGIVITPDGKTAYVANFNSNTVTPIDIATNQPGKPIKVGKQPTALALVP